MAVTVEKLKVDLTFDTTNLRKGLADSIKDVKAFESSLGGLHGKILDLAKTHLTLDNLRKGFDYVKTSVIQAAEAGSALVDMRDRTGIAVEALEHLKFAADQSGASIQQLEIAVKKMQKEISHGSTAAKFEKIGLSIEKIRKLSPEDQLLAIGDAISKLPNATARAAAAQEIFGKSGTDLLPMFKDGKNGIAALVEESKRLGGVWTTESAEAAEKFGDQISKLQAKSERFAISIGNKLIPVLQELSDIYVDRKLPESGGTALSGIAGFLAGAASGTNGVKDALLAKKKLDDADKSTVDTARRLWQKQGLDSFIGKLEKVADTQLKGLQTFFVNEKPNAFRDIADVLGVGDAFRQGKVALANAPRFPKQAPDELGDAFRGLKDALGLGPGPLGKLAQAAGPFEGLVNGLGGAFAPLNALVDAGGKIGNAFAGVFGKDGEEKPGKKLGDKGSDELKAFQFGSAEALSAVAKFRNDAKLGDKTADKQLKEAKIANTKTDTLIGAVKDIVKFGLAKL